MRPRAKAGAGYGDRTLEARFSNWLMARDFWRLGFELEVVGDDFGFSRVFRNPLRSTTVMETLWRQRLAKNERETQRMKTRPATHDGGCPQKSAESADTTGARPASRVGPPRARHVARTGPRLSPLMLEIVALLSETPADQGVLVQHLVLRLGRMSDAGGGSSEGAGRRMLLADIKTS